MFLMINLGERAGSGLPKIRQGWEMTGGNLNLLDTFEPYDQTRLLMSFGEGAVETGKVTGKVLELLAADPHLTIPELAVTLGKSEAFLHL
jgi:hypothetical protein